VKKINVLSVILVSSLLFAGCGAPDDNQGADKVKDANGPKSETTSGDGTSEQTAAEDLKSGVSDTLQSVEDLNMTLTDASSDSKKVNEQGMMVEEKWDEIEKMVEEQYPEDYKNIEESLYPLIAEAKKDEPDTESLKGLVQETKSKMMKFQEKLETS
jgi:iron uptake system EfeUOB component EfeO/EfeM